MKINPAFWKWFGDSKVVDADGNPLVVYHGTSAKDFTKFKRRLGDIGIHFGTIGQADDRMEYMEAHGRSFVGARMIPCFLSIKNPLRTKDQGAWNGDNMVFAIEKEFGSDATRRLRGIRSANAQTSECRDFIEARGYDGIVYKNEGETAGASEVRNRMNDLREIAFAANDGKSSWTVEQQQTPEYLAYSQAAKAYEDFRANHAEDSWIAFRPSQIKSAIGNDGTWDSNDANIASNPRQVYSDDEDDKDWGSDEWDARYDKRIAASKRKILADAGEFDIVAFKAKDGRELYVHQTSNSGPQHWQVSFIAADGIPTMDTIFKKRTDALLSIAGAGLSPNIGQPGEWKISDRRNVRGKRK